MGKAKKADLFLIFSIIALFTFIYSLIGINKHNHFQTFAWDTAIFDQQVYLISQLKPPFSSLHGFIGLGDHFHPLLYLVGGLLYKVWSDPRMLYILQSLVATLSVWPLFLLNEEILSKLKLSTSKIRALNLALCLMYLLSVSFQFMVVGEYNDASSVALPLLFTFYFLIKRNEFGYWLAFGFVILTKEEYSLLAIPLSIYIFFKFRDVKKAFITLILGIMFFSLLTFLIMPKISGTSDYIFYSENNKPSKIVIKMITNPALFITKFFDHPSKIETMLVSFSSFGLLPLMSPQELILPLFNLMIRFYDDSVPRRFEYNNQYAAGLVPLLAVATVFGTAKILLLIKKKKGNMQKAVILMTGYLVIVLVSQNIFLHGPINSIFKKQFYENYGWENDANNLLKQIPDGAIISANNSLLPHLSQREKFYLFPKIGDSEYIALDLADGPNKFAPIDREKTQAKLDELISSQRFHLIWQENQSVLLQKVY